MKRYALAAVAALLAILPWQESVRAEPPTYTVTDLGSVGGLVPTITGVNASGQVVGNIDNGGLSMAVRYTNGVGWQTVPGLETAFLSTAMGVNANGDIVGFLVDASFNARAYRFRKGVFPNPDQIDVIDPLPGDTMSAGLGINDNGDVVGYSVTPAGNQVAFRATPPGPAVALPTLGGSSSLACGLNANGQAVGWSFTLLGIQHPMRVDDGSPTATDIQPLDGPAGNGLACAIDADGTVGGKSSANGRLHAFRYQGGNLLDLDTFGLGGSSESNVESISNGISVGWYTLPDFTQRAFAHRDGDGSFDLNTRLTNAPGWVLAQAFGINSNGAIVGNGYLDGAFKAFLLTPEAPQDTTPPVINSVSASPSPILLPDGKMVQVLVAVDATDGPGNPLPVCTLVGIAGGPASDVSVTPNSLTGFVRAIGGRTYTFYVNCADAAGNTTAGSVDVSVNRDTTPPSITSVSATSNDLWPPDGHMASVTVSVVATDNVDNPPACAVSDVSGGAAGDSAFNGLIGTVRAVSGRTYTLTVRCTDTAGNFSTGTVDVVVPRDTTPPDIGPVTATPSSLPSDKNLWDVVVSFTAQDDVTHPPSCGLSSITGAPAGSNDAFITGPLTARLRAVAGRTYTLTVLCSDAAGNASTRSAVVVVPDTTPPVIASVTPSQSSIWPPNGKMVTVTVGVSATDDAEAPPQCSLTSVTGGGAGDAMVTGPFSASLRAQKGNVYSLRVSCSDRAGNTSSKTTQVVVAK